MKAYCSIGMSGEVDPCARSDVILFWFMQPTPNTWTNGLVVVVVVLKRLC